MRRVLFAYVLLAVTAACALASQSGPVSVETIVDVDSITVGERFRVRYDFTYPDSLRMVPVGEIELEKSRLSVDTARARLVSALADCVTAANDLILTYAY